MTPAASCDHALPIINKLFVTALLALAESGNAEQACRLAAQGHAALRQCQTREAERLNALLHSLVRHPSLASPDERGAVT